MEIWKCGNIEIWTKKEDDREEILKKKQTFWCEDLEKKIWKKKLRIDFFGVKPQQMD